MKIKNVRLAFLILTSLIVLSFAYFTVAQEQNNNSNIFLDSDQDGLSDQEEKLYGTDPHNPDTDGDGYTDGIEVKNGYDPTKKGPDDKLIKNDSLLKPAAAEKPADQNMTQAVAQKISALVSTADPTKQDISLEQISSIADDVTNASLSADQLPQIDKKELKIKKQDYKNLSDDQKKAKKKEDFTNYIVTVFYVLSSNSPKPITSLGEISTLADTLTQEVSTSMASRDSSSLNDLAQSGQKIVEQMKQVQVPEEMVDTHIKGLQFAEYALTIKDSINPDPMDPVADIQGLSKIQGFLDALSGFSSDIETKFAEYGITVDDALGSNLKLPGETTAK